MKRTIYSTLPLSILFLLATGFITPQSNPAATVEWETTSYDFGKIEQGVPVEAIFKFKNPGMIPLLITSVKPSCGCTVADFPKQPIASGGTGEIKVTYNAESSGYFSKTITVHANTQGSITKLYVKGEVISK